jgi:hypothetical protein
LPDDAGGSGSEAEGRPGRALRYDERPVDPTELSTDDLPATPVRDRTIPASAWRGAPASLLALGADIGHDRVDYKRRIGAARSGVEWLLWRAGPASGGDARYMALRSDRLDEQYTFRLFPDGTGDGLGPDGRRHTRFREWKESLRDA